MNQIKVKIGLVKNLHVQMNINIPTVCTGHAYVY